MSKTNTLILQLVTKGVKISLFLVLFATIGINVFFIVETTKKLNLQTTADYPTGNDNGANPFPTGTGDRHDHHEQGKLKHGKRGGGEYNHFYNNDIIPSTGNTGFDSGNRMEDSGNDEVGQFNKVDEHQLVAAENNKGNNDQQSKQSNIIAPQRFNQLKLQEFSKPKSISIEVLSSKSKVSVNIDGTTVSTNNSNKKCMFLYKVVYCRG